jgi:SdpC family antimicrobial peptide
MNRPPNVPPAHLRRIAVTMAMSLVATVGLAAAGKPATASTPPVGSVITAKPTAPAASVRFDGATLLKGLFFGLGPAAARYPDLRLARVEVPAEVAARLDLVTADIEARDPGYFARFANAMYSGDHLEIQAAAEDAGSRFRAAAQDRYGTPSATPDGRGTCAAINLVAVANLAVVLNVVAAIVAVGAGLLILVRNIGMVPGSGQPQSLSAEQWVDNVASTLG